MKHVFSNKTNILSFVFFFFFLNSCTQEKLLTYKEKLYAKEKVKNCNGECPTINLNIVEFNPKNKVAKRINETIFDQVCRIGYPEGHQIKNYTELVDNFVEDYYQMSLDSLGSVYAYASLDVSTSVSFQNSNLLNLSMSFDYFFGGAHGNYGMLSYFFNPKTGEEISLEEIFKDREKFKKVAERFFRNQYEIPEQENINSTGFWFENDTFDLPKNIVITQDKITLFYNTYEVASYADGMLIIEIPIKEVSGFIKQLNNK